MHPPMNLLCNMINSLNKVNQIVYMPYPTYVVTKTGPRKKKNQKKRHILTGSVTW